MATTWDSSRPLGRRVFAVLSLWGMASFVLVRVAEENYASLLLPTGGADKTKRRTDVHVFTNSEHPYSDLALEELIAYASVDKSAPERDASLITANGTQVVDPTPLQASVRSSQSMPIEEQIDKTHLDIPTNEQPEPHANATNSVNNTDATIQTASVTSSSARVHSNHSTRLIAIHPNKTRSIAFVHVGKNGGNTVRMALPRLKCRRLPGGLRPQMRCFKDTWRAESPLSHQANAEIHLQQGPKGHILRDDYTTFLFALRNPVTRAISAYQFLHHNNKRSPFAQKKHPLKETFYKTCFPKLQDLLETLEETERNHASNNNSTNDDDARRKVDDVEPHNNHDTNFKHPRHCQRMAVTVLKGMNPRVKYINVHLRDNYQYYYEQTLKHFPDKEVLVIRTEHLWEDLKELDVAMGGPGVFPRDGKVANHNRYKAKEDNVDKASPHQIRDLCCILVDEMKIYQDILNRAVNFSYHRKLQTIQDVWNSCGIDSHQIQRYQQQHNTAAAGPTGTMQPPGTINFSWSKWHDQTCPILSVREAD